MFSVLETQGYVRTLDSNEADAWLLVTCSIRENAEDKIWKKLNYIKALKAQGKVSNPNVFYLKFVKYILLHDSILCYFCTSHGQYCPYFYSSSILSLLF